MSTAAKASSCRCAAPEDADPHPCHGQVYACRKPAKRRLYGARPVALTGVQMKLAASSTWACDECWAEFGWMVNGGAARK